MAATKAVILCVDDEDVPRMLRRLILLTQGYEVVEVSSASEALQLLATRPFDLVLTDQIMPSMTGTELTKRIKATMPRLPVILVSGVNEIPADATYADRFISKIAGPAALFEVVAQTLEEYRMMA